MRPGVFLRTALDVPASAINNGLGKVDIRE